MNFLLYVYLTQYIYFASCDHAREERAILQQFFTRKCRKGWIWGEGMRQTAEVGFISPAQTLASARDEVSHSLTSTEGLAALPGWMDG